MRHHDVSRSERDTVKAAVERNAIQTDALTQSRLLPEEESHVMAVFSLAGPSQDRCRVSEQENGLEAKELELQTLPSLAAENATPRRSVIRLCSSVETLGRDSNKVVRG